MTELMAEAEFMEKRQTLGEQAQKLKIATEVKGTVKLLKNAREVNGQLASTFTGHPTERKTSVVQKGICQGGNPKRNGNADKGEVAMTVIKSMRQSHVSLLMKKLQVQM